uniref:Putative ovule protein n=1 Tax=Solanum chacoense TaxID=4108 RepID=A0A0V0H964_SOLCH
MPSRTTFNSCTILRQIPNVIILSFRYIGNKFKNLMSLAQYTHFLLFDLNVQLFDHPNFTGLHPQM